MKRKNLILMMLLMLTLCFSLSACAGSSSEDKTEEEKVDETKDEEEKEDADNKSSKKDDKKKKDDESKTESKIFTGIVQTYEASEYYECEAYQEAELEIVDDSNCIYSSRIRFADNVEEKSYSASYEEVENGYLVTYYDGYNNVDIVVYVNGSDIVKVADQYSSQAEFTGIEGKYSLDTEIGQVVFEVDENGLVDGTVSVGNKKYDTASLFMYDYDGDGDMFEPEWDLTFSIGETYYDWYIYFAKNSVTYIPYKQAIFGPFEGEYNMDGQLGMLTVNVDKEGNAVADVNIEGSTYHFAGNLYYDSYEDQITFDLYSGEIYLYLILDRFEDGDWYQGYYTVTKQLAAG